MQAAVLREHGGPEKFEVGEIERREPGEGEILVRVLACALNHLDIFVRRGMPGVKTHGNADAGRTLCVGPRSGAERICPSRDFVELRALMKSPAQEWGGACH